MFLGNASLGGLGTTLTFRRTLMLLGPLVNSPSTAGRSVAALSFGEQDQLIAMGNNATLYCTRLTLEGLKIGSLPGQQYQSALPLWAIVRT